MQSKIVILGTGGTIAGTAASADDAIGYTAATLSIVQVVNAVPGLASAPIECEQVAQLDSKDMDYATWQRLAQRCQFHLARDDVAGVVVTHGTDTLEETAYFLHRVLAPSRPLVLTGAMRPVTSPEADGPKNLVDAVAVARDGRMSGVSVVFAGFAWPGAEVRKQHTYRLDAFEGGEAGPLASIGDGQVRVMRTPRIGAEALGLAAVARDSNEWPRVEIVLNNVGAGGLIVDGLVAMGVEGIVVAGTGNGTVSAALEAALNRAVAAGIAVVLASRCAMGNVSASKPSPFARAGALSPVQARIELLLSRQA